MEAKRPLCLYGGLIKELQAGDAFAIPTGGLPYRRGAYVVPYAANTSSSTTMTPTTGRLYFMPFALHAGRSVSQLVCGVATAGSGSTLYMGVYDSTMSAGSEKPGELLASGTASGNTTGLKSVPVSLELSAGQIYWAALLATGATAPVIRCLASAAGFPILGWSGAGAIYSHMYVDGMYDMPSTAPTSGYVLQSGLTPILALVMS